MELMKKDISRIGYSTSHMNGNVTFICSNESAGVEYIMLREILKLFGDFEIINEYKNKHKVEYSTNLPWQTYFNFTIGC